MKKTILLAAFSVAGLVSAKEGKTVTEENSPSKATEQKQVQKSKMQCQTVGILIGCTDEVLDDTICWGSGSHNATYEDARKEELKNARLLNEFYCGE